MSLWHVEPTAAAVRTVLTGCFWTVLIGLELQLGQALEQMLDKRFSGDFQMGLKVLGKRGV